MLTEVPVSKDTSFRISLNLHLVSLVSSMRASFYSDKLKLHLMKGQSMSFSKETLFPE